MARYYRIQPMGLEIAGHRSETSEGNTADGLHVFDEPEHAFCPPYNGRRRRLTSGIASSEYGDEVLELEAEEHRDNGDAEGVCIDPEKARIVRRWTLAEFDRAYLAGEFGKDLNWEYLVKRYGDDGEE